MSGFVGSGHYDRIWARKRGGRGGDAIRPGTRVELAARLVGGGNRLLDLGCGAGALGGLVADRFRLVAGVEFSPVGAAAALAAGTRVILADLNRPPLPVRDGSIDVLTGLDVIEHVLDPGELMGEIARVLRPGGRAIENRAPDGFGQTASRESVSARTPTGSWMPGSGPGTYM